jgi:SsrA-binding protein
VGADIPPYQPSNTPISYDRQRKRKILISKKQVLNLKQKCEGSGLTIIPISLYNKGKVLKCEIALVRGKKKYDKRQAIKQRETDREIQRTLKG